jgi:hypothetical protein
MGCALGQKADEPQEGKESSLSYTHTPLPYPIVEQTSTPAISQRTRQHYPAFLSYSKLYQLHR